MKCDWSKGGAPKTVQGLQVRKQYFQIDFVTVEVSAQVIYIGSYSRHYPGLIYLELTSKIPLIKKFRVVIPPVT